MSEGSSPPAGAVRTVLGDVPAAELGVTYVHEHLIIDSPLVAAAMDHIHLPSVDEATMEVGRCAHAGVGAMVDTMPAAAGRHAGRLAEVARRTGVHVIAVTGAHTVRYYGDDHWVRREEPEVLADLFSADVTTGIDRYDYTGPVVHRTPHRSGVIKVATLGDAPDDAERRLFAAAVETHRRTGVPILTHCEGGRGGLAQIEVLAGLGMPLERVVLSHTDKVLNPGYHTDLLSAGVNLEYDQALRRTGDDGKGTAWLVAEMIAAGHGSRLMLGTDGARRSLWASLGGAPGLAWLASGFRERLASRGVGAEEQHRLFVTNPARFLASSGAETP